MKAITILAALVIIMGIFIYTLNYTRWLIKKKNYRAASGVFMLGIAAVVIPLYTLFFVH